MDFSKTETFGALKNIWVYTDRLLLQIRMINILPLLHTEITLVQNKNVIY